MKRILILSIVMLSAGFAYSQSFAINTDGSTAHASALLDVKSSSKGVLIPRMTKPQRNAIAAPATGLMVYINAPDTVGLSYFDGTGWKWVEDKSSSSNYWSINGNSGTNPNSNVIGTTDNADLKFQINNFGRMYLSKEASLGIGNFFPKYTLDVFTGQAAINNCTINGLRIQDVSATSSCDNGLVMGYTNPGSLNNEAHIWNYGQSVSGVKMLTFGVGPVLPMMRLTSDGLAGIGSGGYLPQYALDINAGIAAVNPCIRNGLRILTAGEANNNCDRGLFMGFDNNIVPSRSVSLWNFSPLTTSADHYFRFGFGIDFFAGPGVGEVLRILPPGKGIGVNQLNPLAMVHITNYTGGGVMPGVMVTNPTLPSGTNGFYTGLQISANADDAFIWNYQNAPIMFGTNDIERMRIHQNGNVGIGTATPGAPLQFANTLVNRKVVLYDANNNDHQYYGFGINGGTLRYQVDDVAANHIFYAGVNASASNELFRIQGNGNAILAGTLTQSSDISLKKNIQPLQNSLQKIQSLNGYTYNWKDENDQAQQIGLIAQEVQQQFPQLVETNNDKLGVNYIGMIPVLLEAIKEQQKQIDELKKIIQAK